MRSFHETYVEGPVVQEDAADWLQEHLGGNFQKAWSNPMLTPYDKSADLWWSQQQDAAIKVKALSRWNNYYVEGTRQVGSAIWYEQVEESPLLVTTFPNIRGRCNETSTTTGFTWTKLRTTA